MGYPDSVLADDEHVVLHRHPHWKRLIPAVAVALAATAAASFAAGLVNPRPWDPGAKNIVFAVIWAVWLVVLGWMTLLPFLSWLTTHFVLTDRRLMFRSGVLARAGIDVPLARIVHAQFSRRFGERMLGAGTLIIEAAGQEPLEFYDVPRVEQVHTLICQEVFDTGGFAGSESRSAPR